MSFDLTPTEDMRHILDAAHTMLAAHYPVARLRDTETGAAQDEIAALADFGTFLFALPEDAGGAGFSVLEEAGFHTALGRHLVTPSALAGALAARAAILAGREDIAGAVMSGATKVCAGLAAARSYLVFDPADAEYALVRRDAGFDLIALAGRPITPEPALGHGRALGRLTIDDPSSDQGPGRAGSGTLPIPVHADVAQVGAVLIAAQLLGVAEAARDLAVDYAKVREQFGRPIGSFQAIKHHCANMAIGCEMISAQLDMAAIALRDAHSDADFQIAALARLAPRIALNNARTCIQVHGGIGFSAEADAQLFVKHAHLLAQLSAPGAMLSFGAPMAVTR